MWVPGTVGISSGQLRAPPSRHVVTESQAAPPQWTAPTPGSAYGRAPPALRPTPASSVQIVARNHSDCRRAYLVGAAQIDRARVRQHELLMIQRDDLQVCIESER